MNWFDFHFYSHCYQGWPRANYKGDNNQTSASQEDRIVSHQSLILTDDDLDVDGDGDYHSDLFQGPSGCWRGPRSQGYLGMDASHVWIKISNLNSSFASSREISNFSVVFGEKKSVVFEPNFNCHLSTDGDLQKINRKLQKNLWFSAGRQVSAGQTQLWCLPRYFQTRIFEDKNS